MKPGLRVRLGGGEGITGNGRGGGGEGEGADRGVGHEGPDVIGGRDRAV